METTGLSYQDAILEIAAFVTDANLEMQSQPFHRIIGMDKAFFPSRGSVMQGIAMSGTPGGIAKIVVDMHNESGLWAAMRDQNRVWRDGGYDVDAAMRSFFEWVGVQSVIVGPFVMAGAGVSHYDFPFLSHHWPEQMAQHFVYHQRDISVMRRFLLENCGDDLKHAIEEIDTDLGKPPHRAIGDLNHAYEYARRIRELVSP